MISENVKVLAEKYCMGIKPTNEQLDEIMDAAFAAGDDLMQVGAYIETLQNGPTKEAVEAEKLKKVMDKERRCWVMYLECFKLLSEDFIRELSISVYVDEVKKMGATPTDIAEFERILEIEREKFIENLEQKREEHYRNKSKIEAERKAEEEAKRKAEEESRLKAEEAKRKTEETNKENISKAKELYDKGKAKTKGLFSANYKEARAFFEEALALGYGDAAYEIAYMYKLGIGGCKKDLQEYLRLIDKGIELHSSYTAQNAAKDFRIGTGVVPKDILKSAMYEGIAKGIRDKYE